MNGRKAKLLRAMAVGCATSYVRTNESIASFKDIDGTLRRSVRTRTLVLNPVCKRKAYKLYKQAVKAMKPAPQLVNLLPLKENI